MTDWRGFAVRVNQQQLVVVAECHNDTSIRAGFHGNNIGVGDDWGRHRLPGGHIGNHNHSPCRQVLIGDERRIH